MSDSPVVGAWGSDNGHPIHIDSYNRGRAAEQRATSGRELHHFEAEQALVNIKSYVENAFLMRDGIDPDHILELIPKDI